MRVCEQPEDANDVRLKLLLPPDRCLRSLPTPLGPTERLMQPTICKKRLKLLHQGRRHATTNNRAVVPIQNLHQPQTVPSPSPISSRPPELLQFLCQEAPGARNIGAAAAAAVAAAPGRTRAHIYSDGHLTGTTNSNLLPNTHMKTQNTKYRTINLQQTRGRN